MSDEPFALSTVPPASLAQDEYDSICATVMASARGRWFLAEYARRNRNADTRLVLDAIERIEAVMRGERGQQAHRGFRIEPLQMAKAIAERRAEAAAIGSPEAGSRIAQDAAPHTPAVFTMAERIQDVAWTMRERGLDPSTCDQIEALAASILSSSSLRDPNDRRARKLGEVLQYLERRINGMLDGHIESAASEQGEATGPGRAPAAANGHDAGDTDASASGTAAATASPDATSPVATDHVMQREPGSPTATEPRIEAVELDPLVAIPAGPRAAAAEVPVSDSEPAPIVVEATFDRHGSAASASQSTEQPSGIAAAPGGSATELEPVVSTEQPASLPEDPAVPSCAGELSATRSAERADVLLQPLPLSAMTSTATPPAPGPTRAPEPPQAPLDVMSEIEEELFCAVPVEDAADGLSVPQPDPARPEQPAPILQSATAVGPLTATMPVPEATAIEPLSAAEPAAAALPPASPLPRPAAPDPLAALDAMSDEERVALFT